MTNITLKFNAIVPEIPTVMQLEYQVAWNLWNDYPMAEHEKLKNEKFKAIRDYVVKNVYVLPE